MSNPRLRLTPALLSLAVLSCSSAPERAAPATGYTSWPAHGGGLDSIRYSRLNQINRDNVTDLSIAWTYDTGDDFERSEMQCNPVVVDGVVYLTTPKLRVCALNGATGQELWTFYPFDRDQGNRKFRNRGVTYWAGEGGPDGESGRIYVAANHWLYSINAKTGKPIAGFGQDGRVDLREGIEGRDPARVTISYTTPGVVYKDLLIVGAICSEGLPSPPGDIRAYDLRTGELRWSFRTIPATGEFGSDTWPPDARKFLGGANNWPGMALDVERGLVFAPTGSTSYDFYGGNRIGDNLFANSLIALNAATGERVWHHQAVMHDVWDRDFPSAPSLVQVMRDGKLIDAVAQTSKSGHLFLFERDTGKHLIPIEEFEVAPSDIPGEVLAKTQSLPTLAFARQRFTEDMLTKRTPESHEAVLKRFREVLSDGQFAPPTQRGTILFPGYDGAAEWGGPAYDPETGLFYVNANVMPFIMTIVEQPPAPERPSGKSLYSRHCAGCHQEDLSGSPPEFPSLENISERYSSGDFAGFTASGGGRMPAFRELGRPAVAAIGSYVMHGVDVETSVQESSTAELRYRFTGYNKFKDPDGYPAIEPPWGTFTAIDLDKSEIKWQIPFGEHPELVAQGLPITGTENYGGPVVTAGGLIFIGATNHDRKFHAFDKTTGELLWETLLPAGGNATPATYEVAGRQYVVIGAGGGKTGAPSGGKYVAFALPK